MVVRGDIASYESDTADDGYSSDTGHAHYSNILVRSTSDSDTHFSDTLETVNKNNLCRRQLKPGS